MQAISRKFFVVLVCSLVFGSGCSGAAPKKDLSSNVVMSGKGIDVQVLNPARLAEGGAVAFEPLKAGADAEATPLLDRFALLIVKGTADAFSEDNSLFKFVMPQDSSRADMVLDGHIEEFRSPGSMDRLMMNNIVSVRIKGNLLDVKTKEVIAVIDGHDTSRNNRKDIDKMAYDIGYAIGRELLK
ncbi:MAG: hypothetical protein HQL16_06390 [Candidatus Omnitrophica bacterium]|nr:hypothetical protein [Candidatus Omnitrophota bacterium]